MKECFTTSSKVSCSSQNRADLTKTPALRPARIRDYAPQDATLHGIADRLQAIQRRNFYQLAAAASHRGRYYHEYTMSIDVTRDSPRWQPPTEHSEEIVTEALRDLAPRSTASLRLNTIT